MPRVLSFYVDDSGSRSPDRNPSAFRKGQNECFALGGILIDDAHKQAAKERIKTFRDRWELTYPLHSAEIRHQSENFSWLRSDAAERQRFVRELTRLLTTLPVLGFACVIDKPGYDGRYRAKYGRRRWHLSKTAFCIVVERAAKHARARGARLRVLPERCSKKEENKLAEYYRSLKDVGCPFDRENAGIYRPLTRNEYRETLYEFQPKLKSNLLMQVADLYLWPMVREGYEPGDELYRSLAQESRIVDAILPDADRPERGCKYSCFELVRGQRRGT